VLLGGCAAQAPLPAIPSIELAAVPFFPQTEYQCGPAALATVLAHEGAPVTAESLVPQVYVEGLRGSLQPELLGATRRNGFIPYVLDERLQSLFAEVAANRPVLVLQNLGFARVPVWHYAVVVGYNAERRHVILRSGTHARRTQSLTRFMRSWERADFWAFVALPPGELPATATAATYVRALAGAEALLPPAAARASFAAALERWPNDELVLFAAAAREHADGRLDTATTLYRRLVAAAPAHAAGRNNLANVLAARGCVAEAQAEAERAVALVAPDSDLYAAISDTLATVRAANPAAVCR
jgi:hypothetical protein